MKITKVKALKCPTCGTFKVTMYDGLIYCYDCKVTHAYEKPEVIKSLDISDQGGSARLSVVFFSSMILLGCLFALLVSSLLDVPIVKETLKIPLELKVGDCYDNGETQRNEICPKGAPEWEVESHSIYVHKILAIGVDKVKAVWLEFSCSMKPKTNKDGSYSAILTTDDKDRVIGRIIKCPKIMVNITEECLKQEGGCPFIETLD